MATNEQMQAVIEAILDADERQLGLIYKAANSRSRVLQDMASLANLQDIFLGDTVQVNSNVSPKYLASKKGVIIDIDPAAKFPFQIRFNDVVFDTKGRRVNTCRFTGSSVTKVML